MSAEKKEKQEKETHDVSKASFYKLSREWDGEERLIARAALYFKRGSGQTTER